MQQRSDGRAGAPILKDGEALDRLLDRTERWAASYAHVGDESRWEADFDAKFRKEAETLAAQSTPRARAFGIVDWLMAVLLWLIIAGVVLGGSVLLMRPDPFGFWLFVAAAVLIFAIGVGYVYYDTTNPKRAERKLADKEAWLLGATKKRAFATLRERAARR